jgi:hypothetical protein
MSGFLKVGLLSVFFSQALASPIGQPSPAWYGPRPHGCKCGVTLFLRQPTKCQKEPSAYPPFCDIIANRNYNSTDRIPPTGKCHDHNGCYSYESFACASDRCNEFDPCEGCRLSQPDQGPQDFSLQGPGTQIPGLLDLTQLQDFDLSQNGGAQDQGPPAGPKEGSYPHGGPQKGGHRQGEKPKVVELEMMYEHSLSKVETWSELSSEFEPEPKERPPYIATQNPLLNHNFEDLSNPLANWISIPPTAVTVDMQTVEEPAISGHSAVFILTPLTPTQGQPPYQGTQIAMPTFDPADCPCGLGQVNPGGPAQGQQPQLLQQTQQPQPQQQPSDPAQGQGVAVGGPGEAPDQKNHLILETWASKPSLLEPCGGSDQRRCRSEDATRGKD